MARTPREIIHDQMRRWAADTEEPNPEKYPDWYFVSRGSLSMQPDYGSPKGAAVPRGEDNPQHERQQEMLRRSTASHVEKQAFNKENAPELLGQLIRVLRSNEMEDSLEALKRCGLTRKLNDEWMSDTRNRQKRKRDKRAARRMDEDLGREWKRHAMRNHRKWQSWDADDLLDEAESFASIYWKQMNLDPDDDIPVREVARYAEEQGPFLVFFTKDIGLFDGPVPRVASAERVAAAYQVKTAKRRQAPPMHRRPGGAKHRHDPGTRPGARPPDAWEDIGVGKDKRQYEKALQRMLQKGMPDRKILHSLTTKWRLSQRDAQAELERLKGRYAKRVYSLQDFQTAAFEADRAVGNAVNATIHLKEMWDSFEEIPPKQQPLYDLNLKTMYQLSKPRGYANNVYEKLKRYR